MGAALRATGGALRGVFAVAILVGTFGGPVGAAQAGSLTGVEIDPAAGRLRAGPADEVALSAALEAVPEVLRPYAGMAAGALASAIRQSRDEAMPQAAPIPSPIRVVLQSYFPAAVLGRVRWHVIDARKPSLEAVLAINKDVEAVTLDDVIMFADCRAALGRADLWAHELVHVLQYSGMGVENFATLYLTSGGAGLESQAYDWQKYVAAQLKGRGAPLPPTGTRPSFCG